MGKSLPVISEFLERQQDLTAVQRFAKLHEQGLVDEHAGVYQAKIPLERPLSGQQYGFEVDLDACTGCKACVVGCNKLNGLDEDEAWRAVGTLHGGDALAPMQQTVTAACHHCLDPACMHGCPVGAYEKDAQTGIVRHLDDQCIGCQYCTLTCPYEVPQYNKRLGIVRKCDMCSDRLDEGEEPACVQSCPNEAISIRIVEESAVLDDAQAGAFLPGAPSPAITAPTTVYKTARNLPRNVLPANFYDLRPAAQHLPLVIMLVLTQLSVGAFAVDAALGWLGLESLAGALGPWHSVVSGGLGVLALLAATAHLGRPQYAFRAFLGLRTSWMSREIVAFGLYVKLALLTTLTYLRPDWVTAGLGAVGLGWSAEQVQRVLAAMTAGVGLLGVYCSVLIYVVTGRLFWSHARTVWRFFGTAALLGLGTLAATCAGVAYLQGEQELASLLRKLLFAMSLTGAFKLTLEGTTFRHLLDKQQGDLKRSALLMTGELAPVTRARFFLGAVGGVVLPALVGVSIGEVVPLRAVVTVVLAVALATAAEILERALYFRAVSAPRMPGSIGQ